MARTRTVTATEMARGLSDMLSQVQYRGHTMEITRGKDVVAKLVPAEAMHGFPIDRLDALLAGLPHLTTKESERFLKDMHAGLAALAEGDDPWDS